MRENYTEKTLPRADKNEEKDECLCTGLSTRFASFQEGSYSVYFLLGVLPTPAEFRIFSDSTVPVNITISRCSVKINLPGKELTKLS